MQPDFAICGFVFKRDQFRGGGGGGVLSTFCGVYFSQDKCFPITIYSPCQFSAFSMFYLRILETFDQNPADSHPTASQSHDNLFTNQPTASQNDNPSQFGSLLRELIATYPVIKYSLVGSFVSLSSFLTVAMIQKTIQALFFLFSCFVFGSHGDLEFRCKYLLCDIPESF